MSIHSIISYNVNPYQCICRYKNRLRMTCAFTASYHIISCSCVGQIPPNGKGLVTVWRDTLLEIGSCTKGFIKEKALALASKDATDFGFHWCENIKILQSCFPPKGFHKKYVRHSCELSGDVEEAWSKYRKKTSSAICATKHRYRKPYLYTVFVFRATFGPLVSLWQVVISST